MSRVSHSKLAKPVGAFVIRSDPIALVPSQRASSTFSLLGGIPKCFLYLFEKRDSVEKPHAVATSIVRIWVCCSKACALSSLSVIM